MIATDQLSLNSWCEKNKNQLLIEASRVGLLFLILLFSVAFYVVQAPFINWSYLSFFYSLLIGAMFLHLFSIIWLKKVYSKPWLLLATFAIDLTLISVLVFQSGLNQTFFLFLYMILIALGGFVFRSQGALVLALVASLGFSLSSLWIPEIKLIQHVLILLINNIAFFMIAGLSGYLSEQLFESDQQLIKTGLSLKMSEKLNELLIENIPSGLLTVDENGQVLQANPSARKYLPEVSFSNIKLNEIFKNYNPEKMNMDCEYETPQHDKKIFSVRKSSFFHSEINKELVLYMIDDLTQIRALEAKVRQSEKLAVVGQLAASIAHEIRNPLTGISGSIEMLSQTSAQEDDKKLMKIILREIDRLNNLITEFLEYAKPESAPADAIKLDLLISEVVESLKFSAHYKPQFEIKKNIEQTPEILGRSEKLKQVLFNLIINSFQAMGDSQKPCVEVSCSYLPSTNKVQVIIKDNGQGMSEATLKRLFEPFHTTKPKGTGLGLAVTHKILESHNAEVRVKSSLGQGAEFTMIFPCAKNH
jgi:two-component system sensor histidine kinase PilS (NtrC family)